MAGIIRSIKQQIKLILAHMPRNFRIPSHDVGEGTPAFPTLHGAALHHDIGFLPGQALADQCGEHSLGEKDAVASPQIALDIFRQDAQAVEQRGQTVQGVIHENGGVGHDHAFH